MRMSLLDRAFYLLDSRGSPQDFTLILDLRVAPDVDALYAGARSAMNRFPISACRIARGAWEWRENELKFAASESIQKFIDQPFDLRNEPPVKQMLLPSESGCTRLATRFHHAAADGLSAALWLGHQLNVAYGFEREQTERGEFTGPTLRTPASWVRRSRFAFDGASDRVRTSGSKRSGLRRWSTICFPSWRRTHGFTYNDFLATCILEAITKWNNNRERAKVGLWVPMNVRRDSRTGFGNGTSRVRVYANYDRHASLHDKCLTVREQIAWTTKHGEWVVPELPRLTRLPDTILRPLLRNYLKLPHIDMATAVFTHAALSIANAGDAFQHVERIECVGLLHPRQNLAVNAATHSGHTWLTLTYDPAQLTVADVKQLTQIFSQQIALARRELS
jgi:hypothetical protein